MSYSHTQLQYNKVGTTEGLAGGTVFVEVATRRRAAQSNAYGGTEMHGRPKALVRVVSKFLRKTNGVGTVTSQTPRYAGVVIMLDPSIFLTMMLCNEP